MRPPVIGKIRPGIKVLTRAAQENREAVVIHDRLLAQGQSFERSWALLAPSSLSTYGVQ